MEQQELHRLALSYCDELCSEVPGLVFKSPMPSAPHALDREFWVERGDEGGFLVAVTDQGWTAYDLGGGGRRRVASGTHDDIEPMVRAYSSWHSGSIV